MFTYAKLALALLQVVEMLVNLAKTKQMMDAGADREIARTSASILAKTEAGKKILERVNALSDKDVDVELAGLEPK